LRETWLFVSASTKCEERVERDPTLCEPEPQDKNLASRVPLVFTFLTIVIYFLVEPRSW
jgi:hypothetical protein